MKRAHTRFPLAVMHMLMLIKNVNIYVNAEGLENKSQETDGKDCVYCVTAFTGCWFDVQL